MIRPRPALRGMAVALLMLSAPVSHAAEAPPVIVLVHGAFSDHALWRKVEAPLRSRGYEVVSVSLPLHSLEGDIRVVKTEIERLRRSVVLVGHDWGGTVITEAGVSPLVQGLVYVAAFAHAPRHNALEVAQPYGRPAFLDEISVDRSGFVRLSDKGLRAYFAPDAGPADHDRLAAHNRPIRTSSLAVWTRSAAWTCKPSWYLIAERDAILSPALQAQMAQDIGASSVRLDSDHAPMVSQSDAVADFIAGAAKSAADAHPDRPPDRSCNEAAK